MYAILITSQKLCHYFDAYHIAVVTEYPLDDILHNKEASGRIIKWAVELNTYTIEYRPCQMIKSQALANFFTEWMDMQTHVPVDHPKHWTMYFDGSLNLKGIGQVYISYLHPGTSFATSFGSTFGHPTMPQSMRWHCMLSV